MSSLPTRLARLLGYNSPPSKKKKRVLRDLHTLLTALASSPTRPNNNDRSLRGDDLPVQDFRRRHDLCKSAAHNGHRQNRGSTLATAARDCPTHVLSDRPDRPCYCACAPLDLDVRVRGPDGRRPLKQRKAE
ncbi:hypothetical protein J1605_000360 [Eschrichtius robustus]|uniref:Uncharacterized protein n=1 Tax=Eschrichtius robustus TaxID=9764 RepID=A0AB34H9J6_ESCRO|nr:hypothetical protein J1605_000360 [Eschrichtius robustus]